VRLADLLAQARDADVDRAVARHPRPPVGEIVEVRVWRLVLEW